MDSFGHSPAHIRPHSFRSALALGAGDTRLDEQHQLFVDVLVSCHYGDSVILELPVALKYLPRITTESVEELHDYDINAAFQHVLDHAAVLLAIVPAAGDNVDEGAYRNIVESGAVLVEPGFLGLKRAVVFTGLAGARDPLVADGVFGGEGRGHGILL